MIHKYKGVAPQIGQGVFCAQGTSIIGDVTLEVGANIWFGAVLRGDVNSIHVGKNSNIQDNSTVHVAGGYPTHIGEDVTVGHNCVVHGCTIEENCLIGMGSIILDGAVIGRNSIVGAGSLVTMNKTFPENSLIIGSPAKAVRQLSKEEIDSIRSSAAHYVEYAAAYMEE